MSKTMRDIFTEEEWKLLAQELLPQLKDIAYLPVPEEETEEEDRYEI